MNHESGKRKRGFTFVEVLVVLGVTAVALAITNAALVRLQTRADLDAEVQKLIFDIKSQQLKSMIGETLNFEDPVSFGVRIATSSYTVFRGSAFSVSNESNFTIDFPSSIQVSSSTLPSGTIVFERLSGDVSGFTLGQDSVTLENAVTGATSTLRINKYGAIVKTP